MSFNRLPYDTGAYKQALNQSMAVGDYRLNAPQIECRGCFSKDPAVRQASIGGAVCKDTCAFVDTSSELLGITRHASQCPLEQFLPSCSNHQAACAIKLYPDCPQMPREDTRTTNPPCTLRGTGWNRWEWLCMDPQDKALVPFDFNIQYRLVAKDNHRPCVPCPMNVAEVLPPNHASAAAGADGGKYLAAEWGKKGVDETLVPAVHWRTCRSFAPYASSASTSPSA